MITKVKVSEFISVFFFITLLSLPGCGNGSASREPAPQSVELTFDFSHDQQGWVAGSSDYPMSSEAQMNITTGLAKLPEPLDSTRSAHHLAGNNFSDDLFLYIKKPITGLKPDTQYSLMFYVTIASNTTSFNVMYLKAGASILEPDRTTTEPYGSQYYVMNVDKGNQSQGGKDAIVIGTNVPANDSGIWQLKTVSSPAGFIVRTDQNGALWLLVGGDCTFEVWNEIYYTNVRVVATPM